MYIIDSKSRRPRPCGFTLIETMIASVIIGVAVTALLVVLAAGSRANGCPPEKLRTLCYC